MPSEKPVLIYDGDCKFCMRWVERLRFFLKTRIDYRPFQECAKDYPQIPYEFYDQSVHLVQPDGRFCSAAEAIFRALALRKSGALLFWLYRYVPGFAPVSEAVYRWVARNRSTLSSCSTSGACSLPSDKKP